MTIVGTEATIECPTTVLPEKLLDGRYRLRCMIGQGAFGSVYLADHVALGRRVAIKLLSPTWAGDTAVLERFRREARATNAARHPNIVDIRDAGETPDGRPYIVMELVMGRTLAAVLRDEGPLQPARAVTIMCDVARAIAAAHSAGVIHRDLKPSNVMVIPRSGGGEEVKVLDFGVAAALRASKVLHRRTTGVVGTPGYMPPEQRWGDTATPAFDVFSIGVTLYKLLSGTLPFDNEVLGAEEPPPPDMLRPRPLRRDDVPPALARCIESCLSPEPSLRPPSAAALADTLRAILVELEGEPGRDEATRRWRRAASPPRAGRPRKAFFQHVLLATGVGVGLGFLLGLTSYTSAGFLPPITASAEVLAASPRRNPCERELEHARDARRERRWEAVVALTEDGRCAQTLEAERLRVQAQMELRHWEACARTGSGSNDAQVRKYARACEMRL